jgi:hypothetical protein
MLETFVVSRIHFMERSCNGDVELICLSPFVFASSTNASTFSKWCDERRVRKMGSHQHPSVIRSAKLGVEIGNRNTYKLTN